MNYVIYDNIVVFKLGNRHGSSSEKQFLRRNILYKVCALLAVVLRVNLQCMVVRTVHRSNEAIYLEACEKTSGSRLTGTLLAVSIPRLVDDFVQTLLKYRPKSEPPVARGFRRLSARYS